MPGRLTLFLDLDGPILDTSARNYGVYAVLVKELGGAMRLSRAEFWNQKRTGKSSAELLMGMHGLSPHTDQFKRRWIEEIESPAWLALDTLQANVHETLAEWSKSCSLVLVTLRQSRHALEEQMAQLKLSVYFDAILCDTPLASSGWETKRRLIGASGFGAPGVMIGDTEIDLRAGRLLGLAVVGVLDGIRNRELLEKERPDLLVENLAALREIDLSALAGHAG